MLFFGDLPSVNGVRLFAETVVKKMKSLNCSRVMESHQTESRTMNFVAK